MTLQSSPSGLSLLVRLAGSAARARGLLGIQHLAEPGKWLGTGRLVVVQRRDTRRKMECNLGEKAIFLFGLLWHSDNCCALEFCTSIVFREDC